MPRRRDPPATEEGNAADAGIICVRHAFAHAARALIEDGVTTPGVDNPQVFRVRSASDLLPKEVNWIEGTNGWVAAVADVPVVSAYSAHRSRLRQESLR